MTRHKSEQISIRPASLSDIEGILALWHDADATPSLTDSEDGIRRAMSEPSLCLLVAEVDGTLAGSIIGTFDGWRGNCTAWLFIQNLGAVELHAHL